MAYVVTAVVCLVLGALGGFGFAKWRQIKEAASTVLK